MLPDTHSRSAGEDILQLSGAAVAQPCDQTMNNELHLLWQAGCVPRKGLHKRHDKPTVTDNGIDMFIQQIKESSGRYTKDSEVHGYHLNDKWKKGRKYMSRVTCEHREL